MRSAPNFDIADPMFDPNGVVNVAGTLSEMADELLAERPNDWGDRHFALTIAARDYEKYQTAREALHTLVAEIG